MSVPALDWAELHSFVKSLGFEGEVLTNPAFRQASLAYLELLRKKNEDVNLTAVLDLNTAFWKHLADSLALLSFEPLGDLVDWGSGGGLPGIPLALARKFSGQSERVLFLDSVGKKIRAVEEFAKNLDVSQVNFFVGRGEDLIRSGQLTGAQTAVMRAVAPPERAVKWLHPKIPHWIFFLGPTQRQAWEKEVPAAKRRGFAIVEEKHFFLPKDQGERYLLKLSSRST